MKRLFLILSILLTAAFSSNAQMYLFHTDATSNSQYSKYYEKYISNNLKPRSIKVRVYYNTNQILINDYDSLLYILEGDTFNNPLFPSEPNNEYCYTARDQDELKCTVHLLTDKDKSKWIIIQYIDMIYSYRLQSIHTIY